MKKGWTKKEVENVRIEIAHAERVKSPAIRIADEFVYWLVLFAAIVGNFLVSVILVPFLIVMRDIHLYFALPILGFLLGALLLVLLKGISHLEKRRHVLIWLFAPTIALINVFIITRLSNKLAEMMNIQSGIHSPITMGILYSTAFVLPFVIKKIRDR